MGIVSKISDVEIYPDFLVKFNHYKKVYDNIISQEKELYKKKIELLIKAEREIAKEIGNKFGVIVKNLEFYIFEICEELMEYDDYSSVCYIKLNGEDLLIYLDCDSDFEEEILSYFKETKNIDVYPLNEDNLGEYIEKNNKIEDIIDYIQKNFVGGRYEFLCD